MAAASTSSRKIVILGAGFLGKHIARELAQNPLNRIQLTSRNPKSLYNSLLNPEGLKAGTFRPERSSFTEPCSADITNKSSLVEAFTDASVIISLVGVLSGDREKFEAIQWKGVQNIIQAVQEVNDANPQNGTIAKVIHVSAIGADLKSNLDYYRTKALAEKELFTAFGETGPSVTVIRPSLVFGEGDGFFMRFATLSKYMPFLPVFGGGKSLFQPVFAGDIARAIELLSKTEDKDLMASTRNTIIQAGGPDVLTYRQMMELILKHTGRSRPIVSLPFAIGTLQGMVLERLPENILTVTQNQIEQLKQDNIIDDQLDTKPPLYGEKYMTLAQFMAKSGESGNKQLSKLDDRLPEYL